MQMASRGLSDRYEPILRHDYQDARPSQAKNGAVAGKKLSRTRPKIQDLDADYSLKSLDRDWHPVFHPHLHGIDETEGGYGLPPGSDELDARGNFNGEEVRRELRGMSRQELEGRLGISWHKVEDILDRAERLTYARSKRKFKRGEIRYKEFLEVLREYRLSTEQASPLLSFVRVFAFVEEFTCSPPPLAMLTITVLETAIFIYNCYYLSSTHSIPTTWTGPVPYCSSLIYNPRRRWEIWRFMSYMLVHIGIGHFVFNMLMQVLVGVFLEMEQSGLLGSLKVLCVYLAGVLAGSLGTSLSDPRTYIAGASGGVYSIIAAHLATLLINWEEDSQLRIKKVVRRPLTKVIRIAFISLLCLHDIVYAVYVRFYEPENTTGFMGHLCGAMAGLSVGLFILDNRNEKSWEPYVQVFSLLCYLAFLVFAVIWNVWGNVWSQQFFPPPDFSLYEVGKCRHFDYM